MAKKPRKNPEKKTEIETLISVRCSSPEEKEMLVKAGKLEDRKAGPYVLWAAKEYTRLNHPEIYAMLTEKKS